MTRTEKLVTYAVIFIGAALIISTIMLLENL